MDKELEKFIEDNRDLIDDHQWKELCEKLNEDKWSILVNLLSQAGITTEEIIKDLGGLPDSAFRRCTNLTSITIPEGVKSIGNQAFSGCYNLTSVVIPNSVESIGEGTFEDCTSLTSITIPNSVTSIEDYTLSDCYHLTDIIIPDSVISIGSNAFVRCYRLVNINYKGKKSQWKAIKKGRNWGYEAGDFVIHCTDGDLTERE